MTPVQYVKRYRVQKAAGLLTSTNRRIADIAGECRFQNVNYSARTFRGIKGCTPGEFRQTDIRRGAPPLDLHALGRGPLRIPCWGNWKIKQAPGS